MHRSSRSVEAKPPNRSRVCVCSISRASSRAVAGRTLASHGAQTLLVNGPHLPNIAPLVIDTGRGKRSTWIDLRDAAGIDTLHALAHDADVFLQSYRPGARGARLRAACAGDAAPRHRVCVDIRVRACGAVGAAARLRQPRAVGERDRVAGAAGRARAAPPAVPGARSRNGLSRGVRCNDRAAPGARRGSWHVRLSLAQTDAGCSRSATCRTACRHPISRIPTCATGSSASRRRSARSTRCGRPSGCRRPRRRLRARPCRSVPTRRAGASAGGGGRYLRSSTTKS